MSRQGDKIARQHAENLPAFSSLEEAQRLLFAFRDEHLELLTQAAQQQPELCLDYTPASLKRLETWYFQLWESDSFERIGLTRETFEICMAMYFGGTVVRSAGAGWIVEQYFLAPGKYELGVRKGSVTRMLRRFSDYYHTPGNRRRQGLYREFKKYFT
jgi:hypothetical protein